MSAKRQTPPSYMTAIIGILKNRDDLRTSQILKPMLVDLIQESNEPWKNNVVKILKQFEVEGLLVIKGNKVSLPKSPPEVDHDFYCFECHLPGDLVNCTTCHRAFHSNCARENPERSNDMPNSYLHFDVDDHLTEVNLGNILNNTAQTTATEPVITLNDTDDEMDLKPELAVIYVGETRAPSRKRPGSLLQPPAQYKRECSEEASPSDDRYTLCTCCRLLKIAPLRHPPNLGNEELCYLLRKPFTELSRQVKFDLSSCFSSRKLSAAEINCIKTILCIDYWSLKDIKYKLMKNHYEYVLEFLMHILDVQHVAGIIYGKDNEQYQLVQDFVQTLSKDLTEIIRCPDCVRHSFEKHTPYWFAKPCVQRHEVVMARTRGSPYWPAKVMHVLKDNRHIVRFFGGKHDRAMITADNIRSFEIDLLDTQLVKKKSVAFIQAFNEAILYTTLSSDYTNEFRYNADKSKMESIIESLVPKVIKNKKDNNNTTIVLNETMPEQPLPKETPLATKVDNNNSANIQAKTTRTSLRQRTRSLRKSLEGADVENSNDNMDKKNKMYEDEIEKLKQKIKKLEAENRRLKLQLNTNNSNSTSNNASKKGKKLKRI